MYRTLRQYRPLLLGMFTLFGCGSTDTAGPSVATTGRALIAQPGQWVQLSPKKWWSQSKLGGNSTYDCLGIASAGESEGNWLINHYCKNPSIAPERSGWEQLFQFVQQHDGYFQLQVRHTGKCLTAGTVYGSSNGDHVVQMRCDSSLDAVQLFAPEDLGNGFFRIRHKSGRYLDVNQTNHEVTLYDWNGGDNQQFASLPTRGNAIEQACASDTDKWNDGSGCIPVLSNGWYGVRFGSGYGHEWRYYDAIDRCAFWHDNHCWSKDDVLNNSNAKRCFQMADPISIGEAWAKNYGQSMPIIPTSSTYFDPLASDSGQSESSNCVAPASYAKARKLNFDPATMGPYDQFMRVPWANRQGLLWSTQRWLAGDFDGDKKTDLANVFNNGGPVAIDIHRATPKETGRPQSLFSWDYPAQYNGGGRWPISHTGPDYLYSDAQDWLAGDWNGDGKTDLAAVYNDGGLTSVDVFLSNGTSCSTCSGPSFTGPYPWARQLGGYTGSGTFLAGDFTGDGKADIARVFNDGGLTSIDVLTSTGSEFSWRLGDGHWANRAGGYTGVGTFLVGNFNNDSEPKGPQKADIARVFPDGGLTSIDVLTSTGTRFDWTYSDSGRWATRDGGYTGVSSYLAGDFDDDGFDDIARVFLDNGYESIGVNRSTQKGFVPLDLWAVRYGMNSGFSNGYDSGYTNWGDPMSAATFSAQRFFPGKFNGVRGAIAKVYAEPGGTSTANIDVFSR